MVKCLIADDSKIIRLLLLKIMSNFGFEVLDAEDGEEAVDLFYQHKPELIIMDWRLPVMEGLDVLYKIRADKKIKQPKVMFCSSMTGVDKIKETLQGGADDYIMKPFDEEIIGTKLAIFGLI